MKKGSYFALTLPESVMKGDWGGGGRLSVSQSVSLFGGENPPGSLRCQPLWASSGGKKADVDLNKLA